MDELNVFGDDVFVFIQEEGCFLSGEVERFLDHFQRSAIRVVVAVGDAPFVFAEFHATPAWQSVRRVANEILPAASLGWFDGDIVFGESL